MQNTLNVDGTNVPVGPYFIQLMQQWQKHYANGLATNSSIMLSLEQQMQQDYLANYAKYNVALSDLNFAVMDQIGY